MKSYNIYRPFFLKKEKKQNGLIFLSWREMQLLCHLCFQVPQQYIVFTLNEGHQCWDKDPLFECCSCRAPPAVLLCSYTYRSLRLTMNKVAAMHQKVCGTQYISASKNGTNKLTAHGHWYKLPANWNIVSLGCLIFLNVFNFLVSFCCEQ